MSERPSISAFFPAYNDAGTIPSMVITVIQTLRQVTDDFEVIVINDASQDHTGEVLAELEQLYDCVRVVTHEKNRGYGGALRSGFSHATKELIFYTDGDAQYDPRELQLLIKAYGDGQQFDMVNGFKIRRNDPLHRIIIGTAYQYFVRIAFSLKITDTDCDFRLMHRRIFDKVQLESDTGVICVEMMKKIEDAGFRIAEVPVHHYSRAYGQSQIFQLPRMIRILRALFKMWFRLVVHKDHLKSQPAANNVEPGRKAAES